MNSSLESNSAACARDLDELMNRIRAEVAERKQLSGAIPPAALDVVSATDLAKRKWTARELLSLPATDFARATYVAFLGREPSPDEFVRLRDRLLVESVGRMRILREFRRSAEARARRLPIEGLIKQFVWDRIYWSPPAKFGRFVGRGARNLLLLRRHVREFVERVDTLERRAVETTAALRNLQSAQVNDRQNTTAHVRRLRETIEAENRKLEAENRKTGARLEQTDRHLQSDLNEAKCRLQQAETRLVDHWRGIVEHKFELQELLAALETSAQAFSTPVASEIAQQHSHLLDPLYLSFEDRYRGTRADIKQRQRVYVERAATAWEACNQAPVVDIGCGRGEWLELLSEAGIAARGYDLNRIAIEECRARGLDVQLGDGVKALADLATDSCSVVTCFHVIEHLQFESMVELLDHSLRVLRPGGLLILETPNPANLIVSAERFYLDPTHRNPLPSELTVYLLQSRGYSDVEVLPLHPVHDASEEPHTDPMLRLLRQMLYGPQDYGAIGRKST